MDSDDKAWVEQAVDQASMALQKNVIVLLIKRNGDTDVEMVVTNATVPELVSAMWPNVEVQE